MRILIVGALPDLGAQCAAHIASHWPGARLDGVAMPAPQAAGWSQYDAILVAHMPPLHDGLAWLAGHNAPATELPPLILLSLDSAATGASGLAAIRGGAADCLPVERLPAHRLVGAINDAILDRARLRDRELARARLNRRYATANAAPAQPAVVGIAAIDAPEINGYRVLRQIGEGGTSRVFLAQRLPRLGVPNPDPRQIVLKVVDARTIRDPAFIERFIREYRIISTVQNEHVARIYDQGVTDDHLYIAMEYFARGDLKSRMGQQGEARLSPLQSIRLAAQIARALDAIHTAGVIHRDLKPHNIMFRDASRLALVDFGLAKQDGEKSITVAAGIGATPLYMSPEQCIGRTQDARSDLYSLGVILYEMLAGTRLYDGDNLAAIAFQHVHAEVPRLTPVLQPFQAVIDRLLAKDPDDRFQSARELFAKIAL